jgi:putative transposase
VLHFLAWVISAALKQRALAVAQPLCLQRQLRVLRRSNPTPRPRNVDRQSWVGASRWFARWRNSLLIVKAETVLRWHRRGWRAYWSWRSNRGRRSGDGQFSQELQALIRWMTVENRLWGSHSVGPLRLRAAALRSSHRGR